MKGHHGWIGIVFAVSAAAVGGSGCSSTATAVEAENRSRDFIRLDPGNPRLSYIKVEVARESDAPPSLHLTGRIALDDDHTQRLSSPIDGRVVRILAQLGDSVKKGQPLIELASARVAEIGADGRKAALRSQIAGTVVESSILVGQEVRADGASPLVTITHLGTVWVLADVDERDLGLVAPGASVRVRVPAYPSETFAGRVDHVGDVVDPVTRTVRVRCVVPNAGLRLKPEMLAKIDLVATAGHPAIVLPARAILTYSEHSRVIVASEGNVFRQRIVEVGPEIDGQVTIASGIKPGDKVVTSGAIFLRREMESD